MLSAREGNQDAFAELVYSFQDAVYNLCYRMLGQSTEAEDATQEAFIRAYLNLHRYDLTRPFKTWLLSIASNHCIDRLRKRRMQFLSLDEPLPSGSALALSSDEPGPEQVTMSNERGQLIQGLLDQLKPDDRAAIIYRYWYDYSYAEIADVLDSTESAIKSRLFRARRLLADLYQEGFDEPADDDRPINPRLLQE
ncbi:MAG: sigma-70 family RNA polymerase sigma factor [Anaerolineae bacterium]|nr:sigma-70 family RNA polymerase sigma factor [Anaerolineae bacterium]MCA9889912.1 sigma-70 family RNA polymerase sigma factor [Anaerolineae bacterium]MCA9892675.1 sigma-70 family RNA polymerase sigma factor [Anaerolineae bacterium]MCB9458719.1 sigma-70 family RNA polymerase sigma factor [Anaerolineaceae bacterium]